MSDEKALLAAIWEHPHEDAPRLVYADWLQETGEPANVGRAEFIRVQCELARIEDDEPPRPGAADLESWGMGAVECPHPSARRAELLRREITLRKAHATAWKAATPAKLKSAPYHRGFLAPKLQVVSSRKFLSFKEADLAPAPLWDFAMSYNKSDFPKAVASSTFLRVGRLEMRADSFPPPGYFRALADSPNARNLAYLRPTYQFGDDGLLALTASPNLPNLTELQLAYQSITSAGLTKSLTARGESRPLRGLYLRNNLLGDAAVAAIARSPWCANLRALSLEENEKITDAGVEELAKSEVMKGLRYLSLGNIRGLTDRAVLALAESPQSANLRVLFLNHAGFGDKGALALAESPHLARLDFVAMFDTKTKKSGTAGKALVKRFGEKVRF